MGKLLHLDGQIEVPLGEAAGIVSRKREAHTVIADIDVGMVADLLGQLADPIHELQGGEKIFELKGFDKLTGLDLPAREAGQARLRFFRG
jgi:hypothetical protein